MSKYNKGFVFTANEFPELDGVAASATKKDIPSFIDAVSKKENESDPSHDSLVELKRGWIGISKDEHGKTVFTDYINKSDSEEELTPRRVIKKLESNRERFKQEFIELNGADEYDKIYVNYPQYESSDEDVIDNNISEDENVDTDNQEEYDEY